jgi:DNA-binding response OmpR family regulator
LPQGREILLVDDDHRWRAILQDFLELKGFTVTAASSGDEALTVLQRTRPAAVLLDIKMPGLNGLQTLQRVRISHPTLPVILVTQVDEEEFVEAAGTLGVRDYVIKPFHFEQLEAILRTGIGSDRPAPTRASPQ